MQKNDSMLEAAKKFAAKAFNTFNDGGRIKINMPVSENAHIVEEGTDND